MEESAMTKEKLSLSELQGKARCLHCHIIGMTATAGSGHPGCSLSAADVLAALYFGVLRHDPSNPQMEAYGLTSQHIVTAVKQVVAQK